MARVTVEDCVGEGKTDNRFELAILASQRARDIHSGATITVLVENDKKTVVALKEIAAGNIKICELRERFLSSLHPQSAINTLDEESDMVDKDFEQEFISDESEFGLTEDQMLIDEDTFTFEEIDIEDDKKN